MQEDLVSCRWVTQPGLAWPGLALLWIALLGLAWPGLVWSGLAWPHLAWPGLVVFMCDSKMRDERTLVQEELASCLWVTQPAGRVGSVCSAEG